MSKVALDFVVAKVYDLMSAESCCKDAKDAAKAWLNALGSEDAVLKAKALITELEEDIMPIDDLIGFADSAAGRKYFGEDVAKSIADHAKDIKNQGAKYCDCPACTAAKDILENKDMLLK
ncbi:MAG: molecular chaperone Hsp90 [Longibaculum sp.]